jgi:hypothetical protein
MVAVGWLLELELAVLEDVKARKGVVDAVASEYDEGVRVLAR